MTDHKPTAGFWITVILIALLLGYLLSFGPACWLCDAGRLPRVAVARIYRPLVMAAFNGPAPIRSALRYYAEYCESKNAPLICIDVLDDTEGALPFTLPVYGVLESLRDTD